MQSSQPSSSSASYYTVFLLSGEALTGLIASLLATAQTLTKGNKVSFSVSVYFVVLAILMGLAISGFLFVDKVRLRDELATRNPMEIYDDNDSDRAAETADPTVATEEEEVTGETDDRHEWCHYSTRSFGLHSSVESPLVVQGPALDDGASYLYLEEEAQSNTNGDDEQSFMPTTVSYLPAPVSAPQPPNTSLLSFLAYESKLRQWMRTAEGHLFFALAAFAFLENGLHTTLLPRVFDGLRNSATLISWAVKLGACVWIFLHLHEMNCACRCSSCVSTSLLPRLRSLHVFALRPSVSIQRHTEHIRLRRRHHQYGRRTLPARTSHLQTPDCVWNSTRLLYCNDRDLCAKFEP